MELMINIVLKQLPVQIRYTDKIMMVGSCFTEHIGNAFSKLKFSVLQNPHGILFGPDAVCKSINSYITAKKYKSSELFQLNEVWNSWEHHSRFSHLDPVLALQTINDSQEKAHHFLQSADWLIITLGSSFSYRLTELSDKANAAIGDGVANCHRAPGHWFFKEMLETGSIINMLDKTIKALAVFNPRLRVIFTISPVRHIRDGVVENNRSKARLIEAVHEIVNRHDSTFYFPAYELVIDVLRDYRFYDIDLVHPNYTATEFVLEKFTQACIDTETMEIMREVKKMVTARRHRAFQPETKAHQQFLMVHFEKAKELQAKYPFLDLREEIEYFSQL